MTSVTINLKEELLRKAKVEAGRKDMSLATFVADVLARTLSPAPRPGKHSDEYQKAMDDFFSRGRFLKRDPSSRWLTREEIYARSGLRRH